MKTKLLLALGAIALGATGMLMADQWNEAITATFDRPVAIPAAHEATPEVLPAGTYVFKLAGAVDRNVILVYNKNQSELKATVIAAPIGMGRDNAADGVIFTTRETPANKPIELLDMYYPGNDFGVEFVYPTTR